MYFRINHSTDPKVIGNVNSQAEHALLDVDVKHPDLSRNIFLRKVENEKSIITVTPIIVKKANLTDLISGSATGLGVQLMISSRLKELLHSHDHQGMQFFPMSIIYKDIELKNYWLTNPFDFTMENINYSKSSFEIQGLGGKKLRGIKVDNFKHFEDVRASLVLPERIYIRNVILRKDIREQLLILRWVPGGVGYYVSKYLKEEIEDAGCTGIDFEPIEQA